MKKNDKGKRIIKFSVFTTLTLLIGFFDLFLTYLGTPDLSNEANPLAKAGLGWVGLIVGNIVFSAACIALYFYSFFIFKAELIPCNGFKEYISMLYYDRPDKFRWIFGIGHKSQKRVKKYALACVGYLAFAVEIARCRAIFEWICVLYFKDLAYRMFSYFENISFLSVLGRFDMLLFVLIIVLLVYVYWFYKQYRINKKALQEHNDTVT